MAKIWGKLTQENHGSRYHTNSAFCPSVRHLHRHPHGPHLFPQFLEVVYSNLRENQLDNGRVNIFIAAFTTCWARLKLYSYLEQLQQQVLYFDTDSVIFSWKPGQPDIPLGDFLGEMTNELDDGDYIIDFTSQDQRIMDTRPKTEKCAAKCVASPSIFVINNNLTTTLCARTFWRS